MSKNKIKKKIHSALDALEMPLDTVMEVPRITLYGSKRAVVENHRGIKLYSDSMIEFAGSGCTVVIRGKKLKISAFDEGAAMIDGVIDNAEVKDNC